LPNKRRDMKEKKSIEYQKAIEKLGVAIKKKNF